MSRPLPGNGGVPAPLQARLKEVLPAAPVMARALTFSRGRPARSRAQVGGRTHPTHPIQRRRSGISKLKLSSHNALGSGTLNDAEAEIGSEPVR